MCVVEWHRRPPRLNGLDLVALAPPWSAMRIEILNIMIVSAPLSLQVLKGVRTLSGGRHSWWRRRQVVGAAER